MAKDESRAGWWDKPYVGRDYERTMYGDVTTAKRAAEYLSVPPIQTVEDWGCGYGGFKTFLRADQNYIGVDGSHSRYADRIADLTTYKSSVDAVHMRHVLEHNPDWRDILINFLASFRARAVLTLFTPLMETETIVNRYPNWQNTGFEMVDIALPKQELRAILAGDPSVKIAESLDIRTDTQYSVEHMFFLNKA